MAAGPLGGSWWATTPGNSRKRELVTSLALAVSSEMGEHPQATVSLAAHS
jgi:hypothetical protein